jgi:hypothetical protein
VTAVLEDSLQGDPSGTGRDLIAPALQAVAQDPLFTAMLRATQARHDETFRALLAEKARNFPIVVFTCRPSDYLTAGAMVPKGKSFQRDTDGGFARAVDLGRAVRRKWVAGSRKS